MRTGKATGRPTASTLTDRELPAVDQRDRWWPLTAVLQGIVAHPIIEAAHHKKSPRLNARRGGDFKLNTKQRASKASPSERVGACLCYATSISVWRDITRRTRSVTEAIFVRVRVIAGSAGWENSLLYHVPISIHQIKCAGGESTRVSFLQQAVQTARGNISSHLIFVTNLHQAQRYVRLAPHEVCSRMRQQKHSDKA